MNLLPPISTPCCSARLIRAMTPMLGRSLSDAFVYSCTCLSATRRSACWETHKQAIFLISELDPDDGVQLILIPPGDTVRCFLLRRSDQDTGRRNLDRANHDKVLKRGRRMGLKVSRFLYSVSCRFVPFHVRPYSTN